MFKCRALKSIIKADQKKVFKYLTLLKMNGRQ
jgi:hypothetical protein